MKKIFAITLLSAAVLAGCSSDDDDGVDPDTTTPPTTGGETPPTTGGETPPTTGGETPPAAEAATLPAGEDYDPAGLEDPATLNLVELATNAQLNALVTAVGDCPALVTALSDADSRLTVFAPNDEAFASADVAAALAVEGADVCDVIAGHVIVDSVASAADLGGNVGRTVTTLAGTTATIAAGSEADSLTIGGANIISADNFATNGVAHVIDAVLLGEEEGDGTEEPGDGTEEPGDGTTPPVTGGGSTQAGVAVSAAQDAGNTSFVSLWEAAGFGLAADQNAWTVFAPTNDSIDDGTLATLSADSDAANAALQPHIITSGALAPADFVDGSTITVNNSAEYAVTNDGTTITVNGFTITPIANTSMSTVYSIEGLLQ